MTKRQFRVLYREFLFRMVDRDLLSTHAQGDASKLLAQFAAMLVFVSLIFAFMLLAVGNGRMPHEAVLVSAWPVEHALIATTMLVVGLFAVLSWDSMFPSRHDVLVLASLPIRTKTIFFAKLASLGAALSIAVIMFNAIPGLLLPLALTPPGNSFLDMLLSVELYRSFAAYAITAFAAGAFILCSMLAVQGIAAQLPRRLFLRLSALLQIAALCLFVSVYFLQPSLATPRALAAHQHSLAWLPSYWFLGLFQALNGSMHPAVAPLAPRALIGLLIAAGGTASAYTLCYFRTLRKIAEEPDIAPAANRLASLPRFGSPITTAIVQFSIRTLCRSRQHRLIIAFYTGLGFAILILFLKTAVARDLSAASASDALRQVSLPVLASSFVMLCFWILGIRVAFAMPFELRANWMFRTTQIRSASKYLLASRRAMFALALAPVWAAAAILYGWLWPWQAAVEHLTVLALLGNVLVEFCLHGFEKIPFACSYLPGKSNVHMTFCLCLLLGLNVVYWAAAFELRSLSDPRKYAWILAVLCPAAVLARWRTKTEANSPHAMLQFEQEQVPAIQGLGLHRDGTLPNW